MQAKQIIRDAMKYKAPRMYKELSQQCMLDQVVNGRADQYDHMVAEAHNRALTKWTATDNPASPEDRIQGLDQDLRSAHEIALEQVTEFAD